MTLLAGFCEDETMPTDDAMKTSDRTPSRGYNALCVTACLLCVRAAARIVYNS